MKLLNIKSVLKSGSAVLDEFHEDHPKYAIISHIWCDQEFLYHDIKNGTGKEKTGYRKILACCELAATEGYEYVFIDSCCIDRSSSVEVSEAINSMFKWYRLSGVCYAYLADVGVQEDQRLVPVGEVMKSQWFTEGWTLQALIAPDIVRFFSANWAECGNRNDLALYLYEITNIDPEVLGRSPGTDIRQCLCSHSLSKRMSWAAMRETKRPEDSAYCLLGLFNVNMHLMYGEGGPRAFHRLQEEIMKSSTDQTILAWNPAYQNLTKTTSVLAESPSAFRDGAKILPIDEEFDEPIEMTSKGVRTANRLYDFQKVLPHSDGYHTGMKVILLSCVYAEQEERGQLGIIATTEQLDEDEQANGTSFVRLMYAPVMVPVKQIRENPDARTSLLSEMSKSLTWNNWEYGSIENGHQLNNCFDTIRKYLVLQKRVGTSIYIIQNIQNIRRIQHQQHQNQQLLLQQGGRREDVYCYFPTMVLDIPRHLPYLRTRKFILTSPTLVDYPDIPLSEISTAKFNISQQPITLLLTESLYKVEGPDITPAHITLSAAKDSKTRLEVVDIQCHCQHETTPKCSWGIFEAGMAGTTYVRCHGNGLEMQVKISHERMAGRVFNAIAVTLKVFGSRKKVVPPKVKQPSKLRGLLGGK